jgi:hypothetical protein
MIFKTSDGKNVEIFRNNFKNDISYYTFIMKAKGFIKKK